LNAEELALAELYIRFVRADIAYAKALDTSRENETREAKSEANYDWTEAERAFVDKRI
jgi:hypothetical protein